MPFIPLPDNAARQLIDAQTVFVEHARVAKQARAYEGGMYWKRQDAHEYLVRTSRDNRQKRLGLRSPQTEQTYERFMAHKREAEERLQSLTTALREAERMNKALKVGRVPSMVLSVLQVLEKAHIAEHFTVVGTHTLYAYEAAAGVRVDAGSLATQDVDLLWDARKRVRFVGDMKRLDASMLRVLQRADPTFVRKDLHNETAINAKGFEVDFLRRMAQDDDPHPFRFSDDEDDLYPVQARRAHVLTEAAPFEHVVVSATGRMALMRTIHPRAFVDFKRWMADSAPGRPALKRRRDRSQAELVQQLLDEGLLQT